MATAASVAAPRATNGDLMKPDSTGRICAKSPGLQPIDWRASATGEPDQLLGYIERQRGDRYEVLWMTDPMRWGYAGSFEEALAAFGDSSRFNGEIVEERESAGILRARGFMASTRFVPWRRRPSSSPRRSTAGAS
jgi:hypothetical protein